MPDYYFLTSPQGSVYNLGSWLRADPGPNFGDGAADANYAENPAAEGGVLAFESIGVRKMSFPLLLASHSAWTGLLSLESGLRLAARPGGAVLDLLPDGTPTAEAVRFDVLTGRLRIDYDVRMHGQVRRHNATLEIDTQPFGYWPTMILLASAASVGGPGVLTFSGGSIFGDAPGLAEIFIAPTSATSYGNTQKTDSVFWSLGARASFQGHWLAASAQPSIWAPADTTGVPTLCNATLVGDVFAPASQALRMIFWTPSVNAGAAAKTGNTITTWQELTEWVVPPVLEPAYRGRFRAYAWARWNVPTSVPNIPFQFSADVQAGTIVTQALGSAAPVATLPPAVASDSSAGAQGASPAYSLLDLGEVSLPPIASNPYETKIRLWGNPATSNFGYATTATAAVFVGGLYLQPLDGAAGILPRGVIQPTWTSPVALGRFYLSAVTRDQAIVSATSVIGSLGAVANAAQHHRGIFPVVGASTLQIDLNLAGKQVQAGAPTGQPPIRSEPHFAQVSVRYRPRFAFLKGL